MKSNEKWGIAVKRTQYLSNRFFYCLAHLVLVWLLSPPVFGESAQIIKGRTAGPGARTLVVFLHGYLGDPTSTWTNEQTKHFWPQSLVQDESFAGVDAFVFGYRTAALATTLNVTELAAALKEYLEEAGALDSSKFNNLVFVTHSMGGLVARELLMGYRGIADKTKFIYFLATPTNGSQVADIGRLFSNNPQLQGLAVSTPDSYLGTVLSRWSRSTLSNSRYYREAITSHCAYEKLPVGEQPPFKGVVVVPQSSATALCNGDVEGVDASHVSIAKPANRQQLIYLRLKRALLEALPGVTAATVGSPVTPTAATVPIPLSRFERLLADARRGDMDSILGLARAYIQGRDAPRDVGAALTWLNQARSQGSHAANVELGMLYEGGIDGAPNLNRAREHYALASFASDAFPEADAALGDFFLDGRAGLPIDRTAAQSLYERSARAGNNRSLRGLAALALTPDASGQRQLVAAISYLKKAALSSDSVAACELAEMYLARNLVVRDIGEADRWARHASEVAATSSNQDRAATLVARVKNLQSESLEAAVKAAAAGPIAIAEQKAKEAEAKATCVKESRIEWNEVSEKLASDTKKGIGGSRYSACSEAKGSLSIENLRAACRRKLRTGAPTEPVLTEISKDCQSADCEDGGSYLGSLRYDCFATVVGTCIFQVPRTVETKTGACN